MFWIDHVYWLSSTNYILKEPIYFRVIVHIILRDFTELGSVCVSIAVWTARDI